MQEARRSNRIPTRKYANLFIGETSFPIRTWEISETGLSASIQVAIPIGTYCSIQFTDDITKTFFVAQVVRSKDTTIALSFMHLTDTLVDILRKNI